LKAILCRTSTKNSYAMHTIKITPNLLFEYQRTSGKFITLPNRIESRKIDSVARIESNFFCPNRNAPLHERKPVSIKLRMRQGLRNGTLSVRLSVPSIDHCMPLRRVCCCGPAGRRYRSIAAATGHHSSTAPGSKCEQCHVVS